jgi:hypothetical protein
MKADDAYLDPGARSRIQLLQIAQQLFKHYLTRLEREWNGFKRRMRQYRQD